jgi:ElaB/YqjD/DUF883 family membrane-anchored ribosome-binding protein
MKMKTQIKKDQIEEALELLNAAAQEKKEEVFELLGDKYEHLKEFFESAAHNGAAIAGRTKEQIAKSLHQEEKKLKEVAAELDEKVHKDPWAFMGGVALGSLVLGLILGRKK